MIEHAIPLADGTHRVTVRAMDRALNISPLTIQTFTIDSEPPRIGSFILESGGTILYPGTDATFAAKPAESLTLTLAIGGNPKKAELKANDKKLDLKFNVSTNLWKTVFVPDREEFIKLVVSAEDVVGNRTEKEIAGLNIAAAPSPAPAPAVESPSLWKRFINLFK
jgi:hypothetical protein